MSTPRLVKIPQQLDTNNLLPGDIIFLLNPSRRKKTSFQIADWLHEFWQSLLSSEYGHGNSHAACLVEKDGQLHIMHVAEDDRGNGVKWEPMSDRLMTGKSALIYRIANEEDRKNMADALHAVIQESEVELKRVRFSGFMTIPIWMRRMLNAAGLYYTERKTTYPVPAKDEKLTQYGICVTTIAELLVKAAQRLDRQAQEPYFRAKYVNILPATLPRPWQGYLQNNPNFISYARLAPVKKDIAGLKNYGGVLKKIALAQIERLMKITGWKAERAHKKAAAMEAILERSQVDVEKGYEEAREAMRALLPHLRTNTGLGLRTPTTYTEVMRVMRSIGLYEEYFEETTLPETSDTLRTHLRCHYTEAEAAAYRQFRDLGYSHREADFEVKPTFGKWSRNHWHPLLLSVPTIVGPLCLFAYGAIKTACAHAQVRAAAQQRRPGFAA